MSLYLQGFQKPNAYIAAQGNDINYSMITVLSL